MTAGLILNFETPQEITQQLVDSLESRLNLKWLVVRSNQTIDPVS